MSNRDFYNENGYYLLKGLYTRDEMNAYITDIHKVFKNRMKSLSFEWKENDKNLIGVSSLVSFFKENNIAYIECMKQAQNLFHTFKLSYKDQIIQTLNELGITLPAFSTKPILMISNAATSKSYAHFKTPPHQDWRSIQGSLNGIITWTALVDVLEIGMGPLEIIPKSHKWGLLDTKKDNWYRTIVDTRVNDGAFIPIPMEQGDCLFFSSFLVHRSGKHNGILPRYSLQFRFNDVDEERFSNNGYPSTYPSDIPTIDHVNEDNSPSPADVEKVFGKTS